MNLNRENFGIGLYNSCLYYDIYKEMKVKHMTLQQIFYALTISQMGSMNKAAEVLFISQPSLTSAIKELEREVKACRKQTRVRIF